MRCFLSRCALFIMASAIVASAAAEVDLYHFQFFQPSVESCQPPNGIFDSFEMVTLPVTVRNTGANVVNNVVVTLAATDGVVDKPGGYLVHNFGSISPGFTATRDFQFQVGRPNHAILRLNFHLTDSEGDWGIKTLHRTVGMAGSATATYNSNVGVPIPDNSPSGVNIYFDITTPPTPAGEEAGLSASGDDRVGDVAIQLGDCGGGTGIDHSWVGDLVMKLRHPDGTEVTLMNRPGPGVSGSSGDDFCSTFLDDEGGGGSIEDIPNGVANNAGIFRPVGPLTRFLGRKKSGLWTLNVADVAAGDTGSVEWLRLIVHEAPAHSYYAYSGPPVAIPDSNSAGIAVPLTISDFPGVIGDLDFHIDGTSCSSDPGSVDVGLSHTFIGDLEMSLRSPSGREVKIFAADPNLSGNNLCNFILDDENWTNELSAMSSVGTPPLGPPYTGVWKPLNALSAFRGENPNGTWKLLIRDLGPNDQGAIRKFSLRISRNESDRDSRLEKLSPFATNATGSLWVPTGQNDPAIVGTDYDATYGAYRVRVFSAQDRFRQAGWVNNRPDWLPYSSVGTGNYVRGKFYVYAAPPPGESLPSNQIPNFKLRLANRFAVTSELQIQTHAAADPGNNIYGNELRPSAVPEYPSIYRLDFDPVDVPYLQTGTPAEGIMSGVEIFTQEPADKGYIALTQTELCVYPALADARTAIAKEYAVTGSDAGNLRIFSTATDLARHNFVSPPPGSPQGSYGTLESVNVANYSESVAGITFDTTPVPTSRIGFIERTFFPGNTDGTAGHGQRLRCEEGKLYKVRFHVTSTRPTSAQSWLLMRGRTIKFAYSQWLTLGGSFGAGSAANQAIARQALPGIGSLNPDKNGTENGGWYTMLMNTPMDTDIRRGSGIAFPLSTLMPNLVSLPGPGVDTLSNRDIKFGAQVYDTLSLAAGKDTEVGNFTIDRIEVRTYGQVED